MEFIHLDHTQHLKLKFPKAFDISGINDLKEVEGIIFAEPNYYLTR